MKPYSKLFTFLLAIALPTQIMNAQDKTEVKKDDSGLVIGAKLPELKVTNQLGKEIDLTAAKGDKWVFVFFYPKALTGGWTKQVCSVQAAFEKLTEKKVTVFGVSTDTAETQLKFTKKESLHYTLVADTEKKLANAFHVPLIANKMTSRQAYLFKDGVLVWRDVKGSTDSQGDEVLKAIKDITDAEPK